MSMPESLANELASPPQPPPSRKRRSDVGALTTGGKGNKNAHGSAPRRMMQLSPRDFSKVKKPPPSPRGTPPGARAWLDELCPLNAEWSPTPVTIWPPPGRPECKHDPRCLWFKSDGTSVVDN